MAGMLFITPGPTFVGHSSIYQFENADGADPGRVCGQAAIATVLANYHRIPQAIAGLKVIEKDFPPDVLSGAWGTSSARIERALSAHKLGFGHARERKGLEDAMRRRRAAIALIQNAPGLGGAGQGAHWFVVFGCDAGGVYVTNFPSTSIAWSKLEEMWTGPIPLLAGMRERVITC
jgi:hypothetical protein